MKAPIFVMGTPRSGTTLTARIIGRHSQIFMPGETHFFDDIYSRREKLGKPGSPETVNRIMEEFKRLYGKYNEPDDQDRIDRLFTRSDIQKSFIDSCHDYRDLFNCFMDIQAEDAGKVRWGNNVPRDLFNIEEILEFYPDVKVLVCVRDIRDFLLSYKDKWQVTSQDNVERLKSLYHPVVTSLLWKTSMRQIPKVQRTIPSCNFMIVRYEELVQNPEVVVRKICDVIGEEFEKNMLQIDSNNSSSQTRNEGIFSTSVGRWRSQLENEHAYIAQLIAGKELKYLDYPIEELSVASLKVIANFVTFPLALWRGLSANKYKRGPLIPYIARRMVSLIRKS